MSAFWYRVNGIEMIDMMGGDPLILSGDQEVSYGRLYNWYAIDGLAPDGWHVPTDAELTTLTDYLGGLSVAGGKLKEEGLDHWADPNTGATNESGFTAFGGGYRHDDSSFTDLLITGWWWSATTSGTGYGWVRYMRYSYDDINRGSQIKENGFSIRLIRDNSDGYTAGEQLTDADGNVYDTVQIGTQIWIVQNYNCTKYADGTDIANVTVDADWEALTTGAYCNYDNDASYATEDADLTTNYIPSTYAGTITAPEVAALIADDADSSGGSVLFTAGAANDLSVSDFIDIDLERIPVKYDDASPHNIRAIGLIDDAVYDSLTIADKKKISNYMHLWVLFWENYLDAGSFDKENRTWDDTP